MDMTADPVALIRGWLDGEAPAGWAQVLGAVAALSATHTPEAEQVLADVLAHAGPFVFRGGGHVPHSQSPPDMIRAAVIETLWRWTGQQYAAAARQAALVSSSPMLLRLVAARFPGGPPAA